MAIKHATVKAPGELLFAVADWNADHIPDYSDRLGFATTRWVCPGWFAGERRTNATYVGRIFYTPIFVAKQTTYIRIGVNVTAAGAAGTKVRLGIYEWNNGLPGTLILDAGTVDVDSTGNKEIIINQTLERDYYFLAIVSDGTPTMKMMYEYSAIVSPVEGIASAMGNPITYVILYANNEQGQVAGGLTDPAVAPTISTHPGYNFPLLRY